MFHVERWVVETSPLSTANLCCSKEICTLKFLH